MENTTMKYISYNKEGRAKYHWFLLSAILRSKYHNTMVDKIIPGKGITSIKDYRKIKAIDILEEKLW